MRERDFQIAAFAYLSVALPADAVVFHPVNEGRRTLALGARLKREGMLAGLPDLCVIYRGQAFWCELKSRRGWISHAQKECHRKLRDAGCPVMVCRSLEDIEMFLTGLSVPLHARVDAYQPARVAA